MSKFKREKKAKIEEKTKHFQILTEKLKEKHTIDIEEIKAKHQNHLKSIEEKFNEENQILNDEFLFLSRELEQLKSLEMDAMEKMNSRKEQFDEGEKVDSKKMCDDLENELKMLKQENGKLVL